MTAPPAVPPLFRSPLKFVRRFLCLPVPGLKRQLPAFRPAAKATGELWYGSKDSPSTLRAIK